MKKKLFPNRNLMDPGSADPDPDLKTADQSPLLALIYNLKIVKQETCKNYTGTQWWAGQQGLYSGLVDPK